MELEKLIDRLDRETRDALEQSALACVERRGIEITIEDLLLRLLEGAMEFTRTLQYFDINIDAFRAALLSEQDTRQSLSTKPVFSEGLIEILQKAWLVSSLELESHCVSAGGLILSLLQYKLKYGQRRYIELLCGIDEQQLKRLIKGRSVDVEDRMRGAYCTAQGRAISKHTGGAGMLDKVSSSLIEMARAGKLDPVIGRADEIRQAIDVLCRRRKNNPILLGEAGVGKTAIVEGLAQRIVSGHVPPELLNVDLRLLDLSALQAGASVKGEFERRITELVTEIQACASPVILFIDEAHLMVGAGANEGSGDVANLIKPALARGELRTIAATTWVEYKRYIEKDPALVRRFQPIKIDEPDIEESVALLRGLREQYETEHGVYVRDDALIAAAELSARYLVGRQLPDKAIDLIDTACARVKSGLSGKPVSVEQLEMQIEGVNRRIAGLKRDQCNDGGITNTENITSINSDAATAQQYIVVAENALDGLKTQLASVVSNWKQEQTLVARIISLRQNQSLDAVPSEEQRSEITRLREELQGVQGDLPILHHEVSAQQVGDVLSCWTGIPAGKMLMDEAQKMSALSSQLGERVKGQNSATQRIGELLCQARVGLNDPDKPLGVFLLVGPSGIGKTETALTIADTLFGGEKYLTTINMSEFQEKHTVSRLIGSPPGYVGYGEGGVLTEAVRQKPFSVVLLDEVEKADPDVLNVFYQVFDKGTLNDGQGRLINFRNTVIVLTSNLASEQIQRLCSETQDLSDDVLMENIRPSLSQFFKPALLARMNVNIYRPLGHKTLEALVESKLKKLGCRLKTQRVAFTIDRSVYAAISRKCVVVEAGARHIDKMINQHIVPKLTRLLLSSIEQKIELTSVGVNFNNGAFEVRDMTSELDRCLVVGS